MTSPRSLLLALLAVGTAAFVAPGAASAITICVHTFDPALCDNAQPDLQAALNAAERISDEDTILLADPGFQQVGPFHYPDGAVLPEKVTIKAVGAARPTLTAPAGATVLDVSDVTLEGVDVKLPSSADGIGIAAARTTLRDVRVTGSGADASGAHGIKAFENVSLDDVEISGTGAAGLSLLSGDVDATRLRITDVTRGIENGDNANLHLTNSKITGQDIALSTRGTSSVSASVLETTALKGLGVLGGDGSVALDHVSVVHRGPVDGTDSALDFHPVDFGGQADLSSVVLAGYTRGIRRDTTDSDFHFPITIRDSVWDNAHDVFVAAPNAGLVSELGDAHIDPKLVDIAGGDFRLRGSSAGIDRDSRTDLRYADVNGDGPVDGDANGSSLADAGALEYRRSAPSIDSADVPPSGTAGQTLAFSVAASDPDGDALQFAWDFGDGTVGTGAQSTHAFAAAGIHTVVLHVSDEAGVATTRTFSIAVTGAAAATTGSGGDADLIAPKLSKVRLSKGRLSKSRLRAHSAKAPALRFTLSERATVRLTVRGVKISKTLSAGRRSIGLGKALRRVKGLPLGRVAVKITATDAAGNRSAARTVKLRIVA
jgi:hypothetical protein